jgi:hypothetical protein
VVVRRPPIVRETVVVRPAPVVREVVVVRPPPIVRRTVVVRPARSYVRSWSFGRCVTMPGTIMAAGAPGATAAITIGDITKRRETL